MTDNKESRPVFTLLITITEDGWSWDYTAPNHGSTEGHGTADGKYFDSTDIILTVLTNIVHDLRGTNAIE